MRLNIRLTDIELTNACNTVCRFCPRDKTPKQGFIARDTFCRAVERQRELDYKVDLGFCGLGEPLLHPDIVDFVKIVADNGYDLAMSTNGSLLTPKLSRDLIAAGLKALHVSASGLHDTYNNIHRLDFESVKQNLLDFQQMAGDCCRVRVSVVDCSHNHHEIDAIKQFWSDFGIEQVIVFKHLNRGGSLSLDYEFLQSDRYVDTAIDILTEAGLCYICLLPFHFAFIGWDGHYYLCCNDFAKSSPLGTVFEYNMTEADSLKKSLLKDGAAACKTCDLNVVNQIREVLFKMDKNLADETQLTNTVQAISRISTSL